MAKSDLIREQEVILVLLSCFGKMSRRKLMQRAIWMLSDKLRKRQLGILPFGKRSGKAYGIAGSDWKIGELILEGHVVAEKINGEQHLSVLDSNLVNVSDDDRDRLREVESLEFRKKD